MIKPLSHDQESKIPVKLISDLRNGLVVAWIGAGLSIGLGYPSWTELVNTIADSITSTTWNSSLLQDWARKNADSNPEWVAEVLYTSDYRQYAETIRNEFGVERTNDSITHALLSLLPFKGYITTNYDTVIENNIRLFTSYNPKVYNNSNAIDLLTREQNEKFVYKIHGDINSNVKDIVLTESDFFGLQKNQIYNKIMSWIFSRYTIVCLGYSLRDRDFRTILEERYQLFGGNCPPMYVFTSTTDTCDEEIMCYRKKYNLNIVPISPKYNFEELTSTLLSLYCLYHRIESEHNSNDIVNLIMARKKRKNSYFGVLPDNIHMKKAHSLLSAVKDGLQVSELVSLLAENNIDITSSHVELLCYYLDYNKIICKDEYDRTEDRIAVAKHIKKELDIIPVDDNPRFLSVYYKSIIKNYANTLIYLLNFEESWNVLITDNNELKRIVEYFRQQGLWKQWLKIAQNALAFCRSSIKLELLRSIAWINFWTRDYDALKEMLKEHPDIDCDSGVNSYESKLKYMTGQGLNELIVDLNNKISSESDYFNVSLLGRAYARLSTFKDNKDEMLENAEKYIRISLNQALATKDLIEIAVQNWYLALVLIDRNKIDEAKIHLSETKRLDENIMERKPGIAWLRVAEYRLALVENCSSSVIKKRREIAYNSVKELGMKNIDKYLDFEYFF